MKITGKKIISAILLCIGLCAVLLCGCGKEEASGRGKGRDGGGGCLRTGGRRYIAGRVCHGCEL